MAFLGNIKKPAGPWPAPWPRIAGYLAIAALFLFLLLTWLVANDKTRALDQAVFNFIAPHISAPRTSFILFVTFFGNHMWLIPANLLLLAWLYIRKENAWALLLLFTSLGGLLVELGVKQILHRLRPDDPVIIGGVAGYSFPSGHALMSVAFYGYLIYFCLVHLKNQYLKIAAVLFLTGWILLIGFTRIYLRVHYMSDVLAGLCAGYVWLWVARWMVERFNSSNGLKV